MYLINVMCAVVMLLVNAIYPYLPTKFDVADTGLSIAANVGILLDVAHAMISHFAASPSITKAYRCLPIINECVTEPRL